MNKKIIYAVVFFLCLAVPLAAHLIAPDRTFSDNENRTLAKMPRATAKGVFSGKFQSDLETYLADQFPLRDGAAAAVSAIRKAAGRRDIGSRTPENAMTLAPPPCWRRSAPSPARR